MDPPTSISEQQKTFFSEQCFVKTVRVSVHNSATVHTITVSQLPFCSAKIELFRATNNSNFNFCMISRVFQNWVTNVSVLPHGTLDSPQIPIRALVSEAVHPAAIPPVQTKSLLSNPAHALISGHSCAVGHMTSRIAHTFNCISLRRSTLVYLRRWIQCDTDPMCIGK